jgi:cholesterol oxidase
MKAGDVMFRETMSGPFAMGVTDPAEGAKVGRRTDWRLTLHATVTVSGDGPAALAGEVRLPGVRQRIPFESGTFLLFPGDDELMRYELGFTHDGARYRLAGFKTAGERPFVARLWPDTTTLYTRLSRGGGVVGAGVLRLGVGDLVRLVASMRAPGATSPGDVAHAIGGFALRFTRGLAEAYLP